VAQAGSWQHEIERDTRAGDAATELAEAAREHHASLLGVACGAAAACARRSSDP
jgi:hypothetical protein